MNPPSQDVKDMLAAVSSLVLAFTTNLFVGEMPATPDECVVVYDTGGYSPEPGYTYERPTVQVRVRGNKGDYRGTHDLAQNVRDFLHGTINETINGARYVAIWCEGDVSFVAYDENRRPLFTVNFRIHRSSI